MPDSAIDSLAVLFYFQSKIFKMFTLFLSICLTLGVSAFCSLLEAILLSTSNAEIEALKTKNPKRGQLMKYFKEDIEQTSSAILALNTIANTLGAAVVGGLSLKFFGEENLFYFSIGMTIGILFLSEIIPKNMGVLHREGLLPYCVYAMYTVRVIMSPIAKVCKAAVQFFLKTQTGTIEKPEKEIILLAEKGAKEGTISQDERDIISNALKLDEIPVYKIMTPRTVMMALEESLKLQDVLKAHPNIPFARIPIYKENMDKITGIIRRRDMLQAEPKANLRCLMHKVNFIPETVSAADALQHFLKAHQQLAIIVDEFGATAGLLTLEDIFESILGKEIFEKDDIAVNMRKLALRKKEIQDKNERNKR